LRRETLWILCKSGALCALIAIAAMYFLSMTALARGVILLFAAFSVAALVLKDELFRLYYAKHRHATPGRAVLLVGSTDRNAEFEKLLADHPEWDLFVAGKLDPAIHPLADLSQVLHEKSIGCVVFNVARTYFDDVERAVLACETEGVEAWLVADFVRTSIARASIADFHGKPVLMFRTTPAISWQLIAKRFLDIAGSGIGLLVLGPLVMLPTAIGIRLTSPGPVLFHQKRSGLHGRQFNMHKFRTMMDNAEMLRVELETFNEMTGPVFKIKKDPRITPIGRFLRKTSIDELPQLWNVLKGDMSLVGPRPLPYYEVDQFQNFAHRRRLSVKPGLTCLWQISGRNQVGFDQWMKLDLEYIDTWSFWLDLKILARTIPVVIGGLGAH
jgi:exopolysaccharide biosynthesis polyprenyl glycosylphosphotransferase